MMRFIKDYLCFTRGERNGTIVLAVIMVVIFIVPYIHEFFGRFTIYEPENDFLTEINILYNSLESDSGYLGQKNNYNLQSQKPDGKEVQNVKMADALQLQSHAAQPELSGSGLKFGYVEPQTVIEQPDKEHQNSDPENKPGQLYRININQADTTELMRIRGIGPVFSRRILNYRDILGGYYCISQLQEVYGIDQERYRETEPYVFADTSLIVRLCLLTDEFRVLLRHPYLNYEQVSYIFSLRNSGGLFSFEDILQSPAFSGTDLNKLLPYLTFK